MPKGSAYKDLMKSVDKYEKSGAADRDRQRQARDEEEERKRAQEEEGRRRQAAEKEGYGARVRQGYENYRDLRDAVRGGKASDDLKAPKKKAPLPGGVRG